MWPDHGSLKIIFPNPSRWFAHTNKPSSECIVLRWWKPTNTKWTLREVPGLLRPIGKLWPRLWAKHQWNIKWLFYESHIKSCYLSKCCSFVFSSYSKVAFSPFRKSAFVWLLPTSIIWWFDDNNNFGVIINDYSSNVKDAVLCALKERFLDALDMLRRTPLEPALDAKANTLNVGRGFLRCTRKKQTAYMSWFMWSVCTMLLMQEHLQVLFMRRIPWLLHLQQIYIRNNGWGPVHHSWCGGSKRWS